MKPTIRSEKVKKVVDLKLIYSLMLQKGTICIPQMVFQIIF